MGGDGSDVCCGREKEGKENKREKKKVGWVVGVWEKRLGWMDTAKKLARKWPSMTFVPLECHSIRPLLIPYTEELL